MSQEAKHTPLDDCTPGWAGAMVAAFSARVNSSEDDGWAERADLETAKRLADALPKLRSSQAEIARLREALTASGDTKAAYIGEFQFTVTTLELDDSDEPYECQRPVTVPWTTVKDIMAAILARADEA